ncbi:hypothetical protein [Stackebrandtia nassauensis]|uniref:Uncharacterized protein n=1 Tax=Stackebrandtia nassauensis (strain DSM 44728 / CIP 108903 / NRRL B-16338 / NBRC 102104 / LLR-40K-21) TaxID=446470 RepID=D3PWR4_STANL|nr:hypothetical protein [Stackebrandtia nassauensis]ADD43286.1 hypothetical protein Snas_3626 [Stackebrandtia nassauensis DSM 44728]
MTTHHDIDAHYDTDDPVLLADLMARVDDLDSHQLADYAIGRGLTPPGYVPGHYYSIDLAWPPGADDGDGVLLWSTSRLGDDGVPADEDDAAVWDSAQP